MGRLSFSFLIGTEMYEKLATRSCWARELNGTMISVTSSSVPRCPSESFPAILLLTGRLKSVDHIFAQVISRLF